ncbi:MAG: 30S ribosomal protein S5 [Candidatus Pacebacteria bacterium]|nr:30S ribosomal protein S5 [Candidatus Paceibacterota bacterium]
MTDERTQPQTPNAQTAAKDTAPTRGAGNDRNTARRPRRERAPRARSEFDNKVIDIRRVTRVVAGGRRFSFSVTLVLGNGNGKVGVGLGKASDTALAIEKATRDAERHMITVPITEGSSIPHDVQVKYASAHVMLIPAHGKGLKAGSAVRTVLELAGVRNVTTKIFSRSKNPLNNARATVLALSALRARKVRGVAKKVTKKVEHTETVDAVTPEGQ